MQENRLSSELASLERRLKILIHEYDHIKQERDALKSENDELKEVLKAKEEHLVNFQNQYKISKIVQNIAVGEQDAAGLKQRIDEYIKEIDKCIAQLTE